MSLVVAVLLLSTIIHSGSTESIFNVFIDKTFVSECNTCDWPKNLNISKVEVYYDNFQTGDSAIYPIYGASQQILSRADFDADQCVHVFVTPFNDNSEGPIASQFRCMLKKTLCNNKKPIFIAIDHSAYTNGFVPLDTKIYAESVNLTNAIGEVTGQLIVDLLGKITKESLILSGHSLGAQIIGPAAVYVKDKVGPLKVIYAIDPAGVCYDNCLAQSVQSGMADTVIAFHCDGDNFGTLENLADYDIYAGNGMNQDGCLIGDAQDFLIAAAAATCSHVKCPSIVFQSAIYEGLYVATKCDTYENYRSGKCAGNPTTMAGYNRVSSGPKGKYYFTPMTSLTCGSVVPQRILTWLTQKVPQYLTIPDNQSLWSRKKR